MRLLGIDLGGTHVKYGLYDNTGRSLDEGRKIDTICHDLELLLQSLDTIVFEYDNLDGLGISVPGGIDKETGVLFEGGALKCLDDVDFLGILQKRYSFPVAMENDANCATLAEMWLGNGKDAKNFVCLTVGTGIGGGMVIDGKLYTGHRNYAGEFGYMRLPASRKRKVLLGCTSTGQLLMYAKEEGFNLTGKEFFKKLDKTEPLMQIYKDWVNDLALGIYNIAVVVDPEKILIGGGISAAQRIYADIREKVDEFIKISEYLCDIQVMPCFFQNDAGKIGAIYHLLHGGAFNEA